MEEDERDDIYRDYVALTQTNIARLLAGYMGADWKMPDYVELLYPESKAKKEPTEEEVVNHILEKLSEVDDGRIYTGSETDAE